MAMGPRPIDPSRPLEVDVNRDDELESKHPLLESDSDVVVAANSEGDEASAEILPDARAFFATANSRARPRPVSNRFSRRATLSGRTPGSSCAVAPGGGARRVSASPRAGASRPGSARPSTTSTGRSPAVAPGSPGRPAPSSTARGPILLATELDAHRQSRTAPTDDGSRGPGDLSRWFVRVERQTLRRLEHTGAIVLPIRDDVASARRQGDQYEDLGSRRRSLDATAAQMQEHWGWRGVAAPRRSALIER